MGLKRFLIFLHRWMGVALCLIFLLWFASGIVLMYCGYPGITPAERTNHLPDLNASRVKLSLLEAFALWAPKQAADEIVLTTFDNRPAYRFRIDRRRELLFADDGTRYTEIPAEVAAREASQWSGLPVREARMDVLSEEDQWTVSGSFRPLRPLYKFTWANGDEVYVSKKTGEVVQSTTRSSRIGAYFGAIPHWLYFTPLRKNSRMWNRVVIWLSGAATLSAFIGLIVGIWMFSPSRRYRHQGAPSRVPYQGQKRLHTILGLFFGLLACTWALSGMMSMDPFPLGDASRFQGILKLQAALRGGKIEAGGFAELDVRDLLEQLGARIQAKEIEFTNFDGKPVYIVHGSSNQSLIVYPNDRTVSYGFDPARLVESVRKAVKPAEITRTRLVTEYEAYYVDRHDLRPLPALFVQLNDAQRSMYYIDPKTARIVEAYDSGARWNRWLYQGLHSFDLPWLYRYRPVWDLLLLALLAGGTWLCVTSTVLAFRVSIRGLTR